METGSNAEKAVDRVIVGPLVKNLVFNDLLDNEDLAGKHCFKLISILSYCLNSMDPERNGSMAVMYSNP